MVMTMSNMQDWMIQNPIVCQCGADKVGLTIYEHSTWCPLFIAPAPITDRCNCGIGSWHSPGCKFRTWPEEPENELKKVQEYMKNVVDNLNDNK